jgi:hypothetical protein
VILRSNCNVYFKCAEEENPRWDEQLARLFCLLREDPILCSRVLSSAIGNLLTGNDYNVLDDFERLVDTLGVENACEVVEHSKSFVLFMHRQYPNGSSFVELWDSLHNVLTMFSPDQATQLFRQELFTKSHAPLVASLRLHVDILGASAYSMFTKNTGFLRAVTRPVLHLELTQALRGCNGSSEHYIKSVSGLLESKRLKRSFCAISDPSSASADRAKKAKVDHSAS